MSSDHVVTSSVYSWEKCVQLENMFLLYYPSEQWTYKTNNFRSGLCHLENPLNAWVEGGLELGWELPSLPPFDHPAVMSTIDQDFFSFLACSTIPSILSGPS